MKYAVNEEGIAALRNMASAITGAIETINGETDKCQSVADDNADCLGPHKAELDEALEDIKAYVDQATSPAEDVAERLEDVAEGYQDVIDTKRFKH